MIFFGSSQAADASIGPTVGASPHPEKDSQAHATPANAAMADFPWRHISPRRNTQFHFLEKPSPLRVHAHSQHTTSEEVAPYCRRAASGNTSQNEATETGDDNCHCSASCRPRQSVKTEGQGSRKVNGKAYSCIGSSSCKMLSCIPN